MLAQSQDSDATFEDEFNKPVESIMRCEDFKSNFARKLSNRYLSWSPVAKSKQDSALKLCQTEKPKIKNNVPERIEQCSQLSTSNILEQNGEIVKPPDKTVKNPDIRYTKENALNMEVDTLRWQLAQTEANRQMHIALLKQIVTFLNRVKEHIECQKSDPDSKGGKGISSPIHRSPNLTDLPRSKSIFHVDKSLDFCSSPTKKIITRKISKSISNVNGYKDSINVWNHSKLSLISENEIANKLTEEMSRLITLANTVLSTKIPDLACAVPENSNENYLKLIEEIKIVETVQNNTNDSVSFVDQNSVDSESLDIKFNNLHFKEFNKDTILDVLNTSQASIMADLRNNSNDFKCEINKDSQNRFNTSEEKSFELDKKSEYNTVSNFIEDESGFSSLNSFQEIGIPIISIIPPSPNKEIAYMEEFPDIIINETEKWKTDSIEFDKQSVKVFWV